MMLGVPALAVWDVVRGSVMPLRFHDDNTATTRICKPGKNPTMRHLERTHRVNQAWLREVCQGDQVRMCTRCRRNKPPTSSQRDSQTPSMGSMHRAWSALGSSNRATPNPP